MISKPTIKICLADIRNGQKASEAFELLEQAKSAIHAAGCKCKSYSFSNIPDGDIATFTFEVISPEDDEREFEVNRFVYSSFDNTSRSYSEVILRRNIKSPNEPSFRR